MKDRVNGKPLPEVIITDMREEVRNGNPSAFSSALKYELDDALKNGNQAILFLNRRGYSQKIICRECGFVAKCEHCDVALTYHREDGLSNATIVVRHITFRRVVLSVVALT